MMTTTGVHDIAPISRSEAGALAATENGRILDLLRSLNDGDWSKPTECPLWDVRAMAGHVLGAMEAFASLPQFLHQFRMGSKAAGDGPFIDGMTEVQVRERAGLTREQLLARLTDAGPRSARKRVGRPGLFRRLPMKQDVTGTVETWRMGYLLDIILTRDTSMHRVDLARATDRDVVLTPEHDGRIIADVVAEWARRHGRSFTLHLDGPAGGAFTKDSAGEDITLDAVEFCRILSGRAVGAGLLTQEVPF